MSRLERYNPLVIFIYFMLAIFIVMFSMHPVIICISFIASFALSLKLEGVIKIAKSLIYILPMIIIITLTNPLFVHKGATELFFINGNAITLEALIYGLAVSLKLSSIIYWFRVYSYIMTSDKVVYLFGKVSPRLSLVLSMSLRFVPLYVKKFREADDATRALGGYATSNIKDKLLAKLHVFSIVFSIAIEGAISTSDSMSARGYGLGKRTNYHNFKWLWTDTITIIVVIILGVLTSVIMALGYSDFDYYPLIDSIQSSALSVVSYISYLSLAVAAVAVEIKEGVTWHILKSRI